MMILDHLEESIRAMAARLETNESEIFFYGKEKKERTKQNKKKENENMIK